jgi:two-component system OmpR family sensor kinase
LEFRLIVVLCMFVVVALVATGSITYTSFRRYAVGQIDQQLYRSANLVSKDLGNSGQIGNIGPDNNYANQVVTPGTVAAELNASGQQILGWTRFSTRSQSTPTISVALIDLATKRTPAFYVTVPGTGNVHSYRALVAPLYSSLTGAKTNDVLVEAIPLTSTNATLHRLLALELLVSSAVLIALVAAALLIIRLSLRPLEKMADTAGQIAAGDLSRRVEDTDDHTEVGRLGRALNTMLGRIETAFRERETSEARLRRFVADASHELRTPLTSIRGYAELFQHGLSERPADLDTAMRRIDSESTRMAGLVDDLLLLARLDQGRPLERETVDVALLAADAAEDARAVDPSRTVTCETPPSCNIVGDEGRLRQLLGNLMANALNYTPAGTPLEIATTLLPYEGLTPARAKISVIDHGPGITQDAAVHVFERFWRSDPARVRAQGGAGLGLSIVASIADAHGGRVSLTETPGGGATFIVELPIVPGPEPKPWGVEQASNGDDASSVGPTRLAKPQDVTNQAPPD